MQSISYRGLSCDVTCTLLKNGPSYWIWYNSHLVGKTCAWQMVFCFLSLGETGHKDTAVKKTNPCNCYGVRRLTAACSLHGRWRLVCKHSPTNHQEVVKLEKVSTYQKLRKFAFNLKAAPFETCWMQCWICLLWRWIYFHSFTTAQRLVSKFLQTNLHVQCKLQATAEIGYWLKQFQEDFWQPVVE